MVWLEEGQGALPIVAECALLISFQRFDEVSCLFECIDNWSKRWTKSSWKVDEGAAGDWELTAGDWYGDAEEDRGVKTTPNARFFAMSAPLTEVFDNKETDLVVQVSAYVNDRCWMWTRGGTIYVKCAFLGVLVRYS